MFLEYDTQAKIFPPYSNTAPGGFIEVSNGTMVFKSDDDTLPKDSALCQWTQFMAEAAINLGRPFNSSEAIANELAEAGYTNIEQRHFKWPTNSWPKDPKMKQLGMVVSPYCRRGGESGCTSLL